MEVLNWVGRHPIITIIVLCIVINGVFNGICCIIKEYKTNIIKSDNVTKEGNEK